MEKKYNVDRARRMKLKSINTLVAIANSGSLSSAAAEYELKRRAVEQSAKTKGE